MQESSLIWCIYVVLTYSPWGPLLLREKREWPSPLNPTGYLCKRLAAHGCIALRALALPWWAKPLLHRGFHRDSRLCRNAPAVTSLAAVFSRFSENENSWRTWSTGLDLILRIKIDLAYKNWSWGTESSANEFSAASLWEKGMTNDIPSRKIRRENTICKEGQKVPLSPDRFLPGRSFWFPSKTSMSVEDWRYIYPCTNHLLLSSCEYHSLSVTRIKGYVCSLSNDGILDCCKIKIHRKYPNKSQH